MLTDKQLDGTELVRVMSRNKQARSDDNEEG